MITTARRIKILSVGDGGVGKSCLIKRHCEGRFVEEYITTIGIDYGVRVWHPSTGRSYVGTQETNTEGIEVGVEERSAEDEVHIHFWDMAGEEVYYHVRNEFYNDADGVLLVFDVTNRRSFESIRDRWLEEMAKHTDKQPTDVLEGVQAVLIGTKTDAGKREVTDVEARALARQLNIEYFDTSASTGKNVDKAFDYIYRRILRGGQMELQESVASAVKTSGNDVLSATDNSEQIVA